MCKYIIIINNGYLNTVSKYFLTQYISAFLCFAQHFSDTPKCNICKILQAAPILTQRNKTQIKRQQLLFLLVLKTVFIYWYLCFLSVYFHFCNAQKVCLIITMTTL